MKWCIALISELKLVVSELPDGRARVPTAYGQFTHADDMILLPILHGYSHSAARTVSEENDKLLAICSSVQSADTKEDSGNVLRVMHVVLHPGESYCMTIPTVQPRRLNLILRDNPCCVATIIDLDFIDVIEGCNILTTWSLQVLLSLGDSKNTTFFSEHHQLNIVYVKPFLAKCACPHLALWYLTFTNRLLGKPWLYTMHHFTSQRLQSNPNKSPQKRHPLPSRLLSRLSSGNGGKSAPLTGMMITINEVIKIHGSELDRMKEEGWAWVCGENDSFAVVSVDFRA